MFVAAMAVATTVLIIAMVEYWWPAPMAPDGPRVGSMAARDPGAPTDKASPANVTPSVPLHLPSAHPGGGAHDALVPQADRLLMLQSGDEPLIGEPAGLDLPPGAETVASFRRRAAGKVEEVATRRIESMTIEQAHAFYAQAAAKRGFKSLAELAGDRPGGGGTARSSRLYVRHGEDQKPDAAAAQILTVRVTSDRAPDTTPPLLSAGAAGRGVRVLLWFQYDNPATPQPDPDRRAE